ncbi:3-deoxy-7-phosphoheptulonate synthase [Billgrantia kenyensis]|uniref:Phospho-2-dehydro-3-deoxyheptonate aldolase n=1 Tax=Billgrantia kenyensis TaxID=321266 RepID=A0A7V9VZ82_9GAMM|nr:3-deoxy-7-phosphoheptulonate synthase [Halomonas kenyensis]MBA2778117.1 3-deoxy-7-phosphoheptulonate synthase [Halomonas kenyensis]MCG6661104.1 3-deoxy-7-phosphoheptulonate synthase [Halomonas kenyensis]
MNAPATLAERLADSRIEALAARPSRVEMPLPTPAELRRRLPVAADVSERLAAQRRAIRAVVSGHDDRMLVVVGPCSIHDPLAALEYAHRLAELAPRISDRLLPVMRVYVEKPRTTVGWKGLAYDPDLDGSGDMARGLHLSRHLMHEVAALGLPVATEVLQPMLAAYLDDLLSWVAIGARTTESQLHRELASGLEAAVGFKNATSGDVGVAVDAIRAAAYPHQHFGLDEQGRPALRETSGNAHTHVVLRGGRPGPNHDSRSVAETRRGLEAAGLPARLMVDCSHANARKDHRRQAEVLRDVVAQREAGETALMGLMLESHLEEGRQDLAPGALRHGVSVTDPCLGWQATEALLLEAAGRLR